MKVLVVSADRTGGSGHPVNIGDAFLTDRLAGAVAALGHQVVVADLGTAPRRAGPPRHRLGGARDLLRAVAASDLVLVGGGTLLQDDVGRGLRGLPRLMAVTSLLGWVTRTRLVFFGVGCDPGARRWARLALRLSVLSREVRVRDEDSATALEQLTGRRPSVAADVCLLGAAPDEAADGATGAVVALAARDAGALTVEVVQRVREDHTAVTFVQMAQDSATGAGDAAALPPRTRAAVDAVTTDLSWAQAMAAYAGADVVVASRMHALYMGMLNGRACSAVGTAAKVRSFAREFGLPRYDDVEAAVVAGQHRRADPVALDAARQRVDAALRDVLGPTG